MIISALYDGADRHNYSKEGREGVYCDVYIRALGNDGEPDFKQMCFRTFDEKAIARIPSLEKGQMYDFELRVTSATITSIE